MELLYIWIEDYKNIHRQGFNFSPKYRFEFTPTTNEQNEVTGGELTCKETDFPDNFFGKGISNVTAIVGENGSGKSTLLEFIKKIFFNSVFEKSDKIITIFKSNLENEKYKIYGYNTFLEKIDFKSIENNSEICRMEKKESDTLKSGFNIPFAKSDVIINSLNPPVIYFSNIFDGTDEKYLGDSPEEDRDISISSNFLLWKEGLAKYKSQEILRQLNFIQNAHKLNFSNNIKIPQYLTIYLDEENSFNSCINKFEQHKELVKILKNYNEILSKSIFFEETLIKVLLYNFIGGFKSSGDYWITKLITILNRHYNSMVIGDKEETLYSIAKEIATPDTNTSYLDLPVLFRENIVNGVFTQTKRFISRSSPLVIDINKYSEVIKELISKYITSINLVPYINFEWQELSSGEKNLLNLYARFYSIKDTKDKLNEIIILIDEGELGLHPQWQKEYLKNLIDVLPEIFEGKQIQIILTSHSPFLVSDLPKENIIFLAKGENGKCVVKDSLNEMKQTFGANIHTLLTDSFFLHDKGLMGKFAESKINDVIDWLNKGSNENIAKLAKEQEGTATQAEKELKLVEWFIKQIGEPIIRNQLQKMLDSRRLAKVETHDEQIAKLEATVQILQNEINKLKQQ